jgi:hypothetical protein
MLILLLGGYTVSSPPIKNFTRSLPTFEAVDINNMLLTAEQPSNTINLLNSSGVVGNIQEIMATNTEKSFRWLSSIWDWITYT